jgi:hypothetical protein
MWLLTGKVIINGSCHSDVSASGQMAIAAEPGNKLAKTPAQLSSSIYAINNLIRDIDA